MIQVVCPACGCKLSAKRQWLGRTGNCPKCGGSIKIAPSGGQNGAPAIAPSPLEILTNDLPKLPSYRPPEHLARLNCYYICDKAHVVATWENNGQGWMVRTDFGFAGAIRNQDALPAQGDFRLVELEMVLVGGMFRLRGLKVYQLARRWALTNLARGDDAILKTVTGPGGLLREQKNAVRQQLKTRFMRDVWADSRAVLDYLGNADYHSPGAMDSTMGG